MNITPDWCRERVAEIREVMADYEMAHSLEDKLYAQILTAIARGECDDPEECAHIALTTQGLDFPRYCA